MLCRVLMSLPKTNGAATPPSAVPTAWKIAIVSARISIGNVSLTVR
jgi:hypothetical protein